MLDRLVRFLERWSRDDRVIATSLALIAIVFFGARLFVPRDMLFNGSFLQDDLFYYFKPAWNFRQHGMISFDTINATNGYQPLYMYLGIALAYVSSYGGFPYVMLAMNAILVAILWIRLVRLCDYFGLDRVVLLITALLTAIVAPLGQFLFNGMETALFAVITVEVISLVVRLVDSCGLAPRDRLSDWIILGVLTGFGFLARLDAFILFIPLYAGLLFFVRSKKLAIAGVAGLATVLPYLAYNVWHFGHIVPVSGLVKSYWASLDERPALARLADAWPFLKLNLVLEPLHTAQLLVHRAGAPDGLATALYLFGAVLVLIAIHLRAKKRSAISAWQTQWSARSGRLRLLILGALVIYWLIGILYYNIRLYGLDFWTYGFSGFFILLVSVSAVLEAWSLVFSRRSAMFAAWVATCLLLLTGPLILYNTYSRELSSHPTFGGYRNNLYSKASMWMNRHVPRDAIVGAWAAGQLGYDTQRRIVQLEGLINSEDVLNAYKHGTILEYIAKQRIEYIACNFIGTYPIDPFRMTTASPVQSMRLRTLRELEPFLTQVWSAGSTRFGPGAELESNYFIWKVDLQKLGDRLAHERRLSTAGSRWLFARQRNSLDSAIALTLERP